MENKRINLLVNDKPFSLEGTPRLGSLPAACGASREQVAMVLNGEIVPRKQWDHTPVGANDRVEIITMAGGG